MQWTIILQRKSENKLNVDTVRKHLRAIADEAEKNKTFGFTGKVGKLAEPEDIVEGSLRYRYRVRVRLEESKAGAPEISQERYEHIRGLVERSARIYKWDIINEHGGGKVEQGRVTVDGAADSLLPVVAAVRPPFHPAILTPEVIAQHFADIYERDPHLRLINDVVQTHVATNGELRAHTILYGLPGGCKTTLLERLKLLYDDEFERVKFLAISASK